MIEISISFWFVLVSSLLCMALGAFWYSPFLFGPEWARLAGKDPKNLAAEMKSSGGMFAWTFVSSLVTSYVLASVLVAFAPQSLYQTLSVSVLVWLGLSAAPGIGEYLFLKRPLRLFLINSGYVLAGFLLVAVLFSIWY